MQAHRYRARTSPTSLKDMVRKRAGNRCEMCNVKPPRNPGGKTRGTIHHRHPRRLGGLDSVENMVLLCFVCHRAIHKDEISAAKSGWISWTEPFATPVLHHAHGWALLVPDGSVEPLGEEEALRLVVWTNGELAAGA